MHSMLQAGRQGLGCRGSGVLWLSPKSDLLNQPLNNYSDRASQPAKLFDDGRTSKVQYDSRVQSESFPIKKGVTLTLVTI